MNAVVLLSLTLALPAAPAPFPCQRERDPGLRLVGHWTGERLYYGCPSTWHYHLLADGQWVRHRPDYEPQNEDISGNMYSGRWHYKDGHLTITEHLGEPTRKSWHHMTLRIPFDLRRRTGSDGTEGMTLDRRLP